MCDTADIGTTVDSANLATPSVFVFDRYPGGLGFAQKTYELIEEVFTSALELISSCPCEEGCPSCVGSPLPLPTGADLDTRGRIPDKEAAVCLLHDLLQREPYVPKPPKNERRATLGEAARQEELGAEPPLEITHLPTQVEAKIRRQLARFRAAGGGW